MIAAAVAGVVLAAQVAAAPPATATTAATAASTSVPAAARFVVVIGYNGGAPDPRAPLSYADDDAAKLFAELAPSSSRAWLLATFDKESARLYPELTDVARPPTRESLAHVLGEVSWLLRQEKKKPDARPTELLFAFAGHGDVNDAGEGFLVFADGPFTRTDLQTQVLEPSLADENHVIIDACASYFMVARGGDESGKVALSPKLLDVLQGKPQAGDGSALQRSRTGVLVSTSKAAEVHESSELSSGVFSYLLRSALAGAADSNGDGRIEYTEAAAFIAAASAKMDDPRARLSVHAEPPLQAPHAPLFDLQTSGASHFLTIDERRPTHLRVLDSKGVPYAEVHAAGTAGGGRAVQLALLGNPYFVVQRPGELKEAVLVPRAAGAYAVSSLRFDDAPRARSATSPQLKDLFAAPFDAAFMTGFLAPSELPPPLAGPAFVVPYAESGSPPLSLPVFGIGVGTLGVAAALGVGAGVSAVGNQLSFQALQADFNQTGVIDPRLSLEVEAWRTAATAFSVGAVVVGLGGGALVLWSQTLDEGELTLP